MKKDISRDDILTLSAIGNISLYLSLIAISIHVPKEEPIQKYIDALYDVSIGIKDLGENLIKNDYPMEFNTSIFYPGGDFVEPFVNKTVEKYKNELDLILRRET